jgi:hypothetical protein
VISTLGEQIIIESPELYNGTYIERDEDGFISNINPAEGKPGEAEDLRHRHQRTAQQRRHRVRRVQRRRQAYFVLAGYDSTYTDPRGRSYDVGVDYKFF